LISIIFKQSRVEIGKLKKLDIISGLKYF
jgi:hypothetical protein